MIVQTFKQPGKRNYCKPFFLEREKNFRLRSLSPIINSLRLGIDFYNIKKRPFGDTGGGIQSENLYKISVPLFTPKTKSIGLGLAIVMTLVGGRSEWVKASSEGSPGKGSVITVRLPFKKREQEWDE